MDACGSYSKKSDKSQSDPSKMSVKFHGCHGHHVGIPVASAPEIERIAPVRVVLLRNRAGLAPPTRSDTFRPPIAGQLKLRLAVPRRAPLVCQEFFIPASYDWKRTRLNSSQ